METDKNVKIARRCASNAMGGYNPEKEQDPAQRMERAYNQAQREGCNMAGWPLHLVIFHETANILKLYAKRTID